MIKDHCPPITIDYALSICTTMVIVHVYYCVVLYSYMIIDYTLVGHFLSTH